jgi:DNA-binding transcriptional regulator YdaS (Cro superfamily)
MCALQKSVDIVGGQSALAKSIDVSPQLVWHWLRNKAGLVPAEHCVKIEKATGGLITRADLRPDVFSA